MAMALQLHCVAQAMNSTVKSSFSASNACSIVLKQLAPGSQIPEISSHQRKHNRCDE
ncbi:hypothetical protein Syun_008870 [Stephania yunnanensis]|uniref:Uncharacterized protein n=1 Tax=Stephania yunnanensis TaxID=152371 RepID=A0AAP0KDB8_9MAGN